MAAFFRALIFLASMLAAASGFAAATIEAASGDVKAGASATAATAVRINQSVASGSYVVSGPKGRATLRFTDGQAVALHENTTLRITDYAFVTDAPARDRSVLRLFNGTMRYVSGTIGQRNPDAVRVETENVIMGVRGTDFMVAIVNPLYFQVLGGQITAVNSAGAPVFAQGAIGTVSAEGTVALTVPASSLPPSVLQAFNQLSLLNLAALTPVEPPTGPAGGVPAGFAGLVIPGAILIGIAAAIAGSSDDSTTSTTTTR